ncbi:NAD-dependent epimerase/dehydratase family protein [Devosia sp.]|uniref:NAD-dependent epimerase/dehydratase family protein n=1 Tax=Devosia sp. TaxID=1871048 RepID=UPI003A918050
MSRQMDPAIRRVVVTGATGFLGKGILRALATRDIEVIAACRTPGKLPAGFSGKVLAGDLTDAGYRQELAQAGDAIAHAGTWGAFYGHAEAERALFYEPARDLMQRAIAAGVKRFLLASTVAIGERPADGGPVDDFSPTHKVGFWPHLDLLIDLDTEMRRLATAATRMVTMRLGHFVGPGNSLGVVPALIPRLGTRMVPWLGRGTARMPMATAGDMGEAFALAATVDGIAAYESFNVHSGQMPSSREVITAIAQAAGKPLPLFSAPYPAGYAFGALMEALPFNPPFLTRSLVHVSEDWNTPITHAETVLGYVPRDDWRTAVAASVAERRAMGFASPALAQKLPAAAL